MVERGHERRSDLTGGEQRGDVLFAVASRPCAPVPQRLGISQTEVLMDVHQCADGIWRKDAARPGLFFQVLLFPLEAGA